MEFHGISTKTPISYHKLGYLCFSKIMVIGLRENSGMDRPASPR